MIPGLVSTVIPVFNRAAMLREAVASVLAQTWPQVELIIVDDGSDDDTPLVMTELREAHPGTIRLLRQANAGPGAARQFGLAQARGEFIQFLDSDDLLLPEKFELQVAGLRADPEAGISYGKAFTLENGARVPGVAQHTDERHRHLFPRLLDEPIWPTLVPLYRHALLHSIGPWPRASQLEDWQYDAQAAALGTQLHYVDEFVAVVRNHGESRLCHLWKFDQEALRQRADAYVSLLQHARRAEVPQASPERQRFARSLFWMARTTAARGLAPEARRLFELARAEDLRPGWDHRLFGLAAGVLGWKNAGRLGELIADARR